MQIVQIAIDTRKLVICFMVYHLIEQSIKVLFDHTHIVRISKHYIKVISWQH